MHKNRRNICFRLWCAWKHKVEYFGDESNLHGVGYVCSLGYIGSLKRAIWLGVIAGSAFGMGWVLLAALALYQDSLVAFSVETDYLEWRVLFPSLTICELLDNEKLEIYLEENNIPFSMTQFYRDVNFLQRVYCKSCVGCVLNRTCATGIRGIVQHYRSNCTQVLTDCWWNGDKFPCCDRFKEVKTEFGVCFAFNSRLALNESELVANTRRTGPATLDFTAMESVFVRIHSADESIIFGGDNFLGAHSQLPFVTDFAVHLKLEETVSSAAVRALPPGARGCLEGAESADDVGARAAVRRPARYSHAACLLQCKAAAQLARCNCTHHLMPVAGEPPGVECECPPACEETMYRVVYVHHKQHNDRLTKELLARGTRGSVRLAQLPTVRVRRLVIRDMLALVVDIGGVGGVFFGASIFSVLEIVYLFCIRSSHG